MGGGGRIILTLYEDDTHRTRVEKINRRKDTRRFETKKGVEIRRVANRRRVAFPNSPLVRREEAQQTVYVFRGSQEG